MSVRAVRNNNPGNIRIGTAWQGLKPRYLMTPDQQAEKAFCVFDNPFWGFRAIAEILHTYHRVHGINTIEQIIVHWAPPSENNTTAYIQAVCTEAHMKPDEIFPFDNSQKVADVIHAMSVHECGGWFFKEDDLVNGVAAAH